MFRILKMLLYAGKYAICTFLQNMQNMLRSHDRYKPVSLTSRHVVVMHSVNGLRRLSSAEAGRQCQSVMTEDADMQLLQDHEQSIRKLEVRH